MVMSRLLNTCGKGGRWYVRAKESLSEDIKHIRYVFDTYRKVEFFAMWSTMASSVALFLVLPTYKITTELFNDNLEWFVVINSAVVIITLYIEYVISRYMLKELSNEISRSIK